MLPIESRPRPPFEETALAWFFAFFVVSGFCSLVYQVVWLRLAMAAFGATAPLVSIVVSTFMAGLALGSWGAGRLVRETASAAAALRRYAAAEIGIALGGVLVPGGLALGRAWLSGASDVTWGSLRHYAASGLCVAAVLLPSCTCMGATIPLAMAAIRRWEPGRTVRSFGHLYLANVVGATLGTLAPALVLVEMFGFRRTGLLAASLNAALAAGAFSLSRTRRATAVAEGASPDVAGTTPPALGATPWILFTTGLASMAMEVVWVRLFTPYLGTVVYAFAAIVASYLAATAVGAWAYRRWPGAGDDRPPPGALWPTLAVAALVPLVAADPRIPLPSHLLAGALRIACGAAPLCGTLGFVTPMLVDRWSRGAAAPAARAYALNVVGCIAGPLLAGFVLLPGLGERGALMALAVPLLIAGAAAAGAAARRSAMVWIAAVAGMAALVRNTEDFASTLRRPIVLRDHSATVIAAADGPHKLLLVNGVGMTTLTPVTKLMAHLPLAFADGTKHRGLVICFGMGTSVRSLLSWGVDTTAVELIPSVPRVFGFFHPDGPRRARAAAARVVVDDGRRFLERTRESFDVITVDPPPPVEAEGSSLLYSREFYAAARRRLRPGGVLQQWVPAGDAVVFASFTAALAESFPHVRAFRSIGGYGVHYLAGDRALPRLTPDALAARLPPEAAADLVEWGPATTAADQLRVVLTQEVPVADLRAAAPDAPPLTDDRPVNEYDLVRRLRAGR
jgi:predicted membrane-bound spermidine synthase